MEDKFPKRKQIRLSDYDYSSPGAIFITACAADSAEIFSHVYRTAELSLPKVELTDCGKIIERTLADIPKRYPKYAIDKYAIMPNHVHILFRIEEALPQESCASVDEVMCAFKSLCAVQCSKQLGLKKIWQRSYYDHVIRNEKDYAEVLNYIEYNSEKWLQSHNT